MHHGGAPEWREIVEKSHATLVEELAHSIEADRARAVEMAVTADRAAAARELEAERESAKRELDAERESAKRELDAERESAKRQIDAERESAKRELETERENAKREMETLRESAKRDVEVERERARLEMEKFRGGASAELDSARRELEAERGISRSALEQQRAESGSALDELRGEHATALDKARGDLGDAVSRSAAAARQATAETLNQSLRRMRQANSTKGALELLADLAAAHAPKAVVLVFENNQAQVAAARGAITEPGTGSNGSGGAHFGVPLEEAPALASVIETRDPVTVLARDSEVSPALARMLASGADDKLYLFPVTTRHHVMAMLVVAGEVFPPAAELLAEAAGMRLESLEAAPKEQAADNLIRIQKAGVPASATSDRRSWEDLSVEDQQLHLQAQRVARVRVARMRLDREEAWRRGLAQSDVYSALRRDIESARTEFLQTFLSNSPTMVDYLHLEILRSLANDDDRVLGREYPGPMV